MSTSPGTTKLHPYLKCSDLFVDSGSIESCLPALRAAVQRISPAVTITLVQPSQAGYNPFYKVVFPRIQLAEKALAVLHQRPLPGTVPPIILHLSLKSPFRALNQAPDSLPMASPRIIKARSLRETPEAIFDVLRPYGPVFSVSSEAGAGVFVQFWFEGDAVEAATGLAKKAAKWKLEVYDPCSIFCRKLPPETNQGVLRAEFEKFGTITRAVLLGSLQAGKHLGMGIVSFERASEAKAALDATRKTVMAGREILLSYHVPKPDSTKTAGAKAGPEPAPPPTTTTAPKDDTQCAGCHDRNTLQRRRYEEELKASQAEVRQLRAELEQTKQARDDARAAVQDLERKLEWAMEEQRKREEAERVAEVEAMRKRMEEMAAQERAEKEAKRHKEKEARERRERDKKEALERERAERLRKEREEEERRERERLDALERERAEKARVSAWTAATLKEERRCRERDQGLRGLFGWTTVSAISRLRLVMDEFDASKFSETQPLTKGSVPWPVLTDPAMLRVADIDWEAVEKFCRELATVEYKAIVERLHRMFHPDRWKARRLLATVMDDATRADLEAAANVVAQALTPLWRKSKGYD
ncbi:Polyadenylate-binding protein 1 [Mycena kentingensis (nom. inval.)]|nr:Polyadenylate-binding protein 1 [Mycena kentingensis (nom. inval.)]